MAQVKDLDEGEIADAVGRLDSEDLSLLRTVADTKAPRKKEAVKVKPKDARAEAHRLCQQSATDYLEAVRAFEKALSDACTALKSMTRAESARHLLSIPGGMVLMSKSAVLTRAGRFVAVNLRDAVGGGDRFGNIQLRCGGAGLPTRSFADTESIQVQNLIANCFNPEKEEIL